MGIALSLLLHTVFRIAAYCSSEERSEAISYAWWNDQFWHVLLPEPGTVAWYDGFHERVAPSSRAVKCWPRAIHLTFSFASLSCRMQQDPSTGCPVFAVHQMVGRGMDTPERIFFQPDFLTAKPVWVQKSTSIDRSRSGISNDTTPNASGTAVFDEIGFKTWSLRSVYTALSDVYYTLLVNRLQLR